MGLFVKLHVLFSAEVCLGVSSGNRICWCCLNHVVTHTCRPTRRDVLICSSFLRFCCLEVLRNGRNEHYMTCRKGTAVIIGFLLLISLMSIKKSETGLRGNHHRKLGGHAMAYIDIENPEVCADSAMCSAISQATWLLYTVLQSLKCIQRAPSCVGG